MKGAAMLQQFLLELEGRPAGRFFGFTGGMAVADTVLEGGGPGPVVHKHAGGVRYENMVLVCGTGMSRSFYDWAGSSFNGDFKRMSGAVVSLGHDSKSTGRLEFQDALVSSIELPKCDASSKDPGYLTVSLTPEFTSFKKPGDAPNLGVYASGLPKAWTVGGFRLDIGGLTAECRHVTRVKSLRLGQVIVTEYTGDRRSPRNEAGRVDFSDLSVELPRMHADGFYKWHEDFVIKGNSSSDREKNGSLQFLGPGAMTPYFVVNLRGLGIWAISSPAFGTATALPVTVTMYCQEMTFSAGAAAIK